ncbi:MAG: SDR family oxidoreductase [Myxococcota bacterium]
MRPPLEGTVLITGASAGIGDALARQLAGRAQRLVVVARREQRLRDLARELTERHPGLEVDVQVCDLGRAEAREALLDHLRAGPPVDVLINNAGFGDKNLLEGARWTKLDDMLALNVGALTHLCHHLVPGMVERGRGGVLNVSSGYGLTWTPGLAVYIGTKHYVTGFTESLRAEVAPRGVVVSQVCPGPVLTEFNDHTENTVGLKTPGRVAISAEQCAAEALAAFERGRALTVPGFYMRNLLRLHGVMPRWAWRRLASRMAGSMREAAGR